MKKITVILLSVMIVLSLAACVGRNESAGAPSADDPQDGTNEASTPDASQLPSRTEMDEEQSDETSVSSSTESKPGSEPEGSKILVAYFSVTNNTEGVAQKLADGLDADIYEIVPEQPYTDEDIDYGNSGSRTSLEMEDPDSRPPISGSVENMEQYDIVFIGYPIWWGEAPRIMSTFIECYDFSCKTIAAFCTSGGSGFGSSDSALRASASEATWLDGHRFSAGASAEDVMEWTNSLGIQS